MRARGIFPGIVLASPEAPGGLALPRMDPEDHTRRLELARETLLKPLGETLPLGSPILTGIFTAGSVRAVLGTSASRTLAVGVVRPLAARVGGGRRRFVWGLANCFLYHTS